MRFLLLFVLQEALRGKVNLIHQLIMDDGFLEGVSLKSEEYS